MIILNFALQFCCVWESSTIRHVIVFVFDCLVFVIGFVDVIIGNFYSLGLVVCGVRYPCLGTSMGTNFSNGPSHRFGDVLFRGQKIVCVLGCQRKAQSYPLGEICVLTPQKVPKLLFWVPYF